MLEWEKVFAVAGFLFFELHGITNIIIVCRKINKGRNEK